MKILRSMKHSWRSLDAAFVEQKSQLVKFAHELCQLEPAWIQLWECGAANGIEPEQDPQT